MKSLFSIVVGLGILSSPLTFLSNAQAADTTVAIPCMDGTTVKNAAEGDVCKALLPKCSEMKDKLVAQLKDMLEWKIYGYYYLNKDIKLDKLSGMQAGGAAEGDPVPYPICSVVGHKVSGNEQGEIEKQSIPNGLSCGDYPVIQNGDAWNYKTKIQYQGDYGKKWFSYVMGAYPWELRRNAYEVIKDLKADLSNINDVIHTGAMTADIKQTLEMVKKSTAALSADAKNTCNQPPEKDIITSCTTKGGVEKGGLSATDPVQKLCTLAKSQLALNAVAMPNMLVYEVMDRTKKMHDAIFGNFFSADANPRFKSLIDHCAKNQSIIDKISSVMNPIESTLKNAITARKSYSCNASCLLDGTEYYTWDDWKSSKNSGDGQKQRRCAKKSKFNLLTGNPESSISSMFESEGWTSWLWNPGGWWDGTAENTNEESLEIALNITNPTNSTGFAAMVESIIRRDICPQAGNSKTGANVCDDVGIADKPAGK